MQNTDLGLKDLVRSEKWCSFQEHLSEALDLPIATIDSTGKISSKIHNPCALWEKISPHLPHSSYFVFCKTCILKSKSRKKIHLNETAHCKCPFDLDVFIIPIRSSGDSIVAYVVVGPVMLGKRKEPSEYMKYAESVGIGIEKLMDSIIEINVFSHNKMRSIVKLITQVFSYLAQAAYHKKRLSEITPEFKKMDPMFARYYEEKVLSTFLKACTMALDADSGSVMTVDKDSDKLRIRVATKLDKNIMNDTTIKMGDSLAGIAAETAKPIILPKDQNKSAISKKMKRKYIKSSMIMPFTKSHTNKVYGVINLNIMRKDKEFSDHDIGFVKELVNLASLALTPLK